MSAYNPPIRNLPIFDTLLFREANPEGEGTGALDPRYCRFPLAQGTLSVPDLNLNTTQIHLGNGSASAGTNAITIGTNTIANRTNNISIGNGAGATASAGVNGNNIICIGAGAGALTNLNGYSVNIGENAGSNTTTGRQSINIGRNAGSHAGMPNSSIQINATGTNISSQTTSSSCVIAPIRTTTIDYANNATLFYNTSTSEVFKVPSASFPTLTSTHNAIIATGFIPNIRNIANIPAGLWEFSWSVSSDTFGATSYGIQVQFAISPAVPANLNVAAGTNYGAVCYPATFNATGALPLSHYQSFLYESNGAAGLTAYLCGNFTAVGATPVAGDFTLNAIRIR